VACLPELASSPAMRDARAGRSSIDLVHLRAFLCLAPQARAPAVRRWRAFCRATRETSSTLCRLVRRVRRRHCPPRPWRGGAVANGGRSLAALGRALQRQHLTRLDPTVRRTHPWERRSSSDRMNRGLRENKTKPLLRSGARGASSCASILLFARSPAKHPEVSVADGCSSEAFSRHRGALCAALCVLQCSGIRTLFVELELFADRAMRTRSRSPLPSHASYGGDNLRARWILSPPPRCCSAPRSSSRSTACAVPRLPAHPNAPHLHVGCARCPATRAFRTVHDAKHFLPYYTSRTSSLGPTAQPTSS